MNELIDYLFDKSDIEKLLKRKVDGDEFYKVCEILLFNMTVDVFDKSSFNDSYYEIVDDLKK